MWQIITAVLAIALAVVLVRHYLLRRELGRLARAMGEIHGHQTNRQLTIGTQQPQLAQLAVAVNTLYDDMDADRKANRAAMDEVRQSMANISHDLRTPLTSILGYLKLLRAGDAPPEKQAHYLEVAYEKAGALNRLVSGLFELARLESGGYVFDHRRLDAAALLGEELAGAYAQLEEKGGGLSVELPEGPLWVAGDKGALARVFANLIQNMAHHGQPPMSVSGGREGEEVVFRFANKAPGLTGRDVEQIFQRFFTGDRMRSGRNTGLGLSIVREFAEQMNGAITAELVEGTLLFVLRFPAAA